MLVFGKQVFILLTLFLINVFQVPLFLCISTRLPGYKCMLTSVCFIIKHRPTVHQVSEIATANVNADTVCITAETCHSFVLLLFLYSKLNRLTAAKKLSGDACQTLSVSCDRTSAGMEKSVVGRGGKKKVTFFSQHCLYMERNR